MRKTMIIPAAVMLLPISMAALAHSSGGRRFSNRGERQNGCAVSYGDAINHTGGLKTGQPLER